MLAAANTAPYVMHMRPEDILLPTSEGLCCPIGGFHIDPTRPVDKAVITHAHSDHARPGHGCPDGAPPALLGPWPFADAPAAANKTCSQKG